MYLSLNCRLPSELFLVLIQYQAISFTIQELLIRYHKLLLSVASPTKVWILLS